MAPKYRGDQEDWWDSESSDSHLGQKGKERGSKSKKISPRSVDLPQEDANAIVAEVFPNQCRVKKLLGGEEFLCSYRRAEVIGKGTSRTKERERTPVAVGDLIKINESGNSRGVIEAICQRKNSISRPAPGRESGRHVLAANIDRVIIVASAREPLFSLGLVDRFLVAAEAEGILVSICVTKMDLVNSPDQEWSIYRQLGYTVHEMSLKTNNDALERAFQGIFDDILAKTVVFCGQSGVGKTSLLRALLKNNQIGKIGEVNLYTGKGRHTTTSAVLLNGPHSSQWIDTPGVREFSLERMPPAALAQYFPEMRGLECQARGCHHLDEPYCCARSLPRYASYRKILVSILA